MTLDQSALFFPSTLERRRRVEEVGAFWPAFLGTEN
jgi:hypothetical protein